MSVTGRKGFQLITNKYGKARDYIVKALGNMTNIPSTLLDLESVLCRLRIGTMFYNTDVSHISGVIFPQIDSTDIPQFGVQGGKLLGVNSTATVFPDYSSITPPIGHVIPTPLIQSPPCLEGVNVSQYHPWGGYAFPFPGALPYTTNPLNDGSLYDTRLNFAYPTKFIGGDNTNTANYQQIPMWERARWISIKNTSGGILNSSQQISFTINDNDIPGYYLKTVDTNTPMDVQIWDVGYNIQTPYDNFFWTNNSGGLTNFTQCAIQIKSTANPGVYTLFINIPPGLANNWINNSYWHLLIYFRSKDSFASTIKPNVSYTSIPSNIPISNNNIVLWPIRSFFVNVLPDNIGWIKTGIERSDVLLYAQNKTHYTFYDGNYSTPNSLSRYYLPNVWPSTNDVNIFQNYNIPKNCAVAGCAIVYTRGEDDYAVPSYIFGPPITPEFWPNDWEKCEYFPPIPDGNIVISKFVITNANKLAYGTLENINAYNTYNETNIQYVCKNQIIWIKQYLNNFEQPSINDRMAIITLLPELYRITNTLRTPNIFNTMRIGEYNALIPLLKLSSNLTINKLDITSPDSYQSQVVHGMLKHPIGTDWISPDLIAEPDAIPFDDFGRALIEDLIGQSPSTELMRFDADNLYLTNNVLSHPSVLEIYQSPNPISDEFNVNNSGDKINRDYTFRLFLEDGDENILIKDWYIMASKYLLTNSEYALQQNTGTTIGYFTQSTLSNIDDWRLQGYAALVPDLSQGGSQILNTRVVAPVDNTQITYDQFVTNLQNAGYSQKDINESILRFQEDGGTFYTVDLNHYDNKFTSIKSTSISIADYIYSSETSWKHNLSGGTLPYYSDSFIIAPSGASPGDFEQFGNNSPSVYTRTENSFVNDKIMMHSTEALQFIILSDNKINEIEFYIKAIFNNGVTEFTNNATDGLKISLYSDNNGIPGNIITYAQNILSYNQISNVYQKYKVPLVNDVTGINQAHPNGTLYWVIIEQTVPPVGGSIAFNSGELPAVSGELNAFKIGVQDFNFNTTNQLTLSTNSILITVHFIPDTNNTTNTPLNIADFYSIDIYNDNGNGGIGSLYFNVDILSYGNIEKNTQLFSFTPNTPQVLLKDTSYWLVLTPSNIVKGGTVIIDEIQIVSTDNTKITSISFNNDVIWKNYINADGILCHPAYLNIYGPNKNILGGFNFENSPNLPPPNTKRATDGIYIVNGWCAYTADLFASPETLCIYPRSYYDNFTDPLNPAWKWAKYYNDMYVCIRVKIGTEIVDYYVTLIGINTSTNPPKTPTDGPITLMYTPTGSNTTIPIPAQGIVYLAITDTSSDSIANLNSDTHGAPSSDILVLRSI